MKTIKLFVQLSIISILLIFNNCTKDDDSININKGTNLDEPLNDSRTELFGEVTDPELSLTNTTRTEDGSKEYVTTFTEDWSGEIIPGETSSSTGSWGEGLPTNSGGEIQAGTVTAGEWSDLKNWDFWNGLINNQEYYNDVNTWNIQPIQRYSFEISDISDNPVSNADVLLISNQSLIWKTKTDNKGKAELWASILDNNVVAQVIFNEKTYNINSVLKYEDGVNEIQIDEQANDNNKADIVFVVDATGSMSDEINYLKTELNDVISRIKTDNSSIEMRLGSVFYRDEGDEYVTRPFSFTTNKDDLLNFINEQSATGGGDFPEAVHSALDIAINQLIWESDTKSRLLFLLLDAPPHYNQEVVSSVQSLLIKAGEKGIKIIPITASGIDKATEFLMRAFAILTNGTYVFITDDSGVGNDHLEPTIGQYEIEKLNDLIVRLVNENIE